MSKLQASTVEFDFNQGQFPELVDAVAYWKSVSGQNEFPAWKEIDLMQFPANLVPQVCVVDVDSDPQDFRYRFWGTAITNMHKMDFTGQSIREVPPKVYADVLFQQYARTVERRVPTGFINRFTNETGGVSQYAVVRMPLGENNVVNQVLSAETYGKDKKELNELFDAIAKERGVGNG